MLIYLLPKGDFKMILTVLDVKKRLKPLNMYFSVAPLQNEFGEDNVWGENLL